MNNMRNSNFGPIEATISAEVEVNDDAIEQLLGMYASKVDVLVEKPLGKMPRKMKKHLTSTKDTKWHRKAIAYKMKCTVMLKDCEIVQQSISDGVINIELKR